MLDKIGYNSGRVGNIAEMLAPSRGIRGRAIEWCQKKIYHERPTLP